MSQSSNRSVLLGAAFLMATSAIGPGFLTQTATFTQTLLASFGFVILLSILLDIGAQLNIWRIIAVSEQRAQDIANKVLPGAGYLLALLIVMGGLAFNIGNVGGAGLGLNILTGLSPETGAIISGLIAIGIFSQQVFPLRLDEVVHHVVLIDAAFTLDLSEYPCSNFLGGHQSPLDTSVTSSSDSPGKTPLSSFLPANHWQR